MKSTLVFDYDGSLASIGGEKKLKEVFGIPPIRIYKGVEQTRAFLKELMKPISKKVKHPLFADVLIEEERFELTKKALELELDCLVFDTVSALGLQERNQLKAKRGLEMFDQRSWGIYGDTLNSLIYNVCSLPIKTIFNVHIDRDKELGGEVLELPALKGSTKTEVQKWFDVILYCRVIKDAKTKQLKFFWQTKPQEGRYAKDRLGLLPDLIPQNFCEIFSVYENAGILNPKILVCGDSGTGKTKALETVQGDRQDYIRQIL